MSVSRAVTWLGLVSLLAGLFYFHYSTSDVRREVRCPNAHLPPGSFGYPIVGEGFDLLSEGYSFFGNRAKLYNSSVVKTHLFFERTIALVGANEARLFYNKSRIIRTQEAVPWFMRDFIAPGTMNASLEGDPHYERKEVIMKSFSKDKLLQYLKKGQQGTRLYLDSWTRSTRVLEFRTEVRRLFVDIGMHLFWGFKLHRNDSFLVHMTDLLTSIHTDSFSFSSVPGMGMWHAHRARREIGSYLLPLIKRSRNQTPRTVTLLDNLAQHKDSKSRKHLERAIVSDLISIVRSHFALGNIATFLMVSLANQPQIQARIKNEVESVIGDNGLELTVDELDQLQYLEAVINEVRRYFPLTPILAARVKESFQYQGYCFPKGWRVILDVYGTHLDPRVWRDPFLFQPERWLRNSTEVPQSEVNLNQQDRHNKLCIGERYSVLMLKLLISLMVREYHWSYEDNQDFSVELNLAGVPPQPKDGVLLRQFAPRFDVRLMNVI